MKRKYLCEKLRKISIWMIKSIIIYAKYIQYFLHKMQEPSSESRGQQKIGNSKPEKQLKIMNRDQLLNDLILNKNYIKCKITLHESVPTTQGSVKQVKTKPMLLPSHYTVSKLQEEIKKTFGINPTEGIFLFYKSKKIVQADLTIKQIFSNMMGNVSPIAACLELSVHTTQFA